MLSQNWTLQTVQGTNDHLHTKDVVDRTAKVPMPISMWLVTGKMDEEACPF